MSQIDILSIDMKIKQTFKEESEKLVEYQEKLLDLKKTLKMPNLQFRLIKVIEKNIAHLFEKIKNINNINFYLADTTHLLEKYKQILQTPVKLTFIGRSNIDNKEKNDVISKYLYIAQKYSDVNIEIPTKNSNIICNNCVNKKSFDILDESIYICLVCGSQQEIFLHTSNYKDTDRINISAKYTYDRKIHFRDCINQYQGKQNSSIDPQVYIKLIDQLQKHHLLVGDENTEKEVRFKNITKEHIHIFLKELEYTKHYENVNLIHYQLTCKKPDDISHLQDSLLNDFDILADLYDKKFKNKAGFDRKNFINTQYVLYQLLIRYKHICKKEDFTMLKTIDRKSFHDDVAKSCFEELNILVLTGGCLFLMRINSVTT
jgi:hypothetical protein